LKPEDNFKIVRFEKENFSFKVTKEKIIFNKEAENNLKGTEVPVIDFYPSSSIFFANDDRIIIKFMNGHFFWVDNYGNYGTKIIYAKCESF
jgi:hypothetical protein